MNIIDQNLSEPIAIPEMVSFFCLTSEISAVYIGSILAQSCRGENLVCVSGVISVLNPIFPLFGTQKKAVYILSNTQATSSLPLAPSGFSNTHMREILMTVLPISWSPISNGDDLTPSENGKEGKRVRSARLKGLTWFAIQFA